MPLLIWWEMGNFLADVLAREFVRPRSPGDTALVRHRLTSHIVLRSVPVLLRMVVTGQMLPGIMRAPHDALIHPPGCQGTSMILRDLGVVGPHGALLHPAG